jgi:hypothetical protein
LDNNDDTDQISIPIAKPLRALRPLRETSFEISEQEMFRAKDAKDAKILKLRGLDSSKRSFRNCPRKIKTAVPITFQFLFPNPLRALRPLRETLCLWPLFTLLLLAGVSSAQEDLKQPTAIETAWHDLDSSDASARNAARAKIEAQPFHTWRSRALEETRPWASIEALLALCEACPFSEGPKLRPHLCESITTLRIEQMSVEQLLATIRLTRLVCTRFGAPSDDERQQMLDLWSHIFPPKPEPGAKVHDAAARGNEVIASEARALLAELSRKK